MEKLKDVDVDIETHKDKVFKLKGRVNGLHSGFA